MNVSAHPFPGAVPTSLILPSATVHQPRGQHQGQGSEQGDGHGLTHKECLAPAFLPTCLGSLTHALAC